VTKIDPRGASPDRDAQRGVLHSQVGSALLYKRMFWAEEYPFLPVSRPFLQDDDPQVLTLVDHCGLHWTGCLRSAPRDQCAEACKRSAAQSPQVPQEPATDACVGYDLSTSFFHNGIKSEISTCNHSRCKKSQALPSTSGYVGPFIHLILSDWHLTNFCQLDGET